MWDKARPLNLQELATSADTRGPGRAAHVFNDLRFLMQLKKSGITVYLPRDVIPRNSLNSDDFLPVVTVFHVVVVASRWLPTSHTCWAPPPWCRAEACTSNARSLRGLRSGRAWRIPRASGR